MTIAAVSPRMTAVGHTLTRAPRVTSPMTNAPSWMNAEGWMVGISRGIQVRSVGNGKGRIFTTKLQDTLLYDSASMRHERTAWPSVRGATIPRGTDPALPVSSSGPFRSPAFAVELNTTTRTPDKH